MNRSHRIIPVYTADVSGVCSALYELGGMVVMHDPSGCNSTYNTHDESRWYDQDSLIFISGLSEIDAIMGNDEKLIRDISAAAEELHPRFIALASAPIPYMNGTDLPAIARVLEQKTGIPAFFVPTNGMRDYVSGAGNALAEIARRFVKPAEETIPHSVNLLGLTPLDFAADGVIDSMRRWIEGQGWSVVSCWAMGDTLDTLSQSAEASVNLVVSSVGLSAAKVMEERFGIPYVVGAPVGPFSDKLFAALRMAELSRRSSISYRAKYPIFESKPTVTLIGESVTMGSLAAAIRQKYGCPTRVLCPLADCEGLLCETDRSTVGEEGMEAALRGADIVIADPLYRPICGKGTRFYDLPHWAFSGRCFRKKLLNLIEVGI